MTKKEQALNAMTTALGLLERAGYPISGDMEATARAWVEVLEPKIREHGVWIIKEATLNCIRQGEYKRITVSDIAREADVLTRPVGDEREKNLRILAAAERRAEEEQDELLRNRTAEQKAEADAMWEAWQSGNVSLSELWRSRNGRIRQNIHKREEVW